MSFSKGQRVFLPVSPSPGPLLSLLLVSPSQTRQFQAGAVAAAQHHPHLTGTPTGTAGPGKHWGDFPSPMAPGWNNREHKDQAFPAVGLEGRAEQR